MSGCSRWYPGRLCWSGWAGQDDGKDETTGRTRARRDIFGAGSGFCIDRDCVRIRCGQGREEQGGAGGGRPLVNIVFTVDTWHVL